MIERIKMGYANCYLLSGDGGSVLIDTCNYKDGPKIYERIRDRNVKLILLTHCHFDHVSSAKYLSKRLSVPIAMSEKDNHLIGNGQASILHGNTPLDKFMVFFSQGVLKRASYSVFTPEVSLEDGQKLSEYGVDAQIVALPGHTKGSVGVLTEEKEFVVGDAMFNMLHPTGSRLFEDERIMEQSVEKIRKSGAKTVYVGHGNPIKMA
jgi:hydroxyacylglutathione hydrolase